MTITEKQPPKKTEGTFRSLLRAPKFGNPAKDRVAALQQNILMGLFFIFLLGIVSILVGGGGTGSLTSLGIVLFALLLCSLAFYWQRRGHLERASWLLVGMMYLVFALSLAISGETFTIALLLAIVISLAGLLLQYYRVIAVISVSIITLWIFSYTSAPAGQFQLIETINVSAAALLEGLLLIVASHTLEKSFAEADRSTQNLIKTNKDLQDLTTNLELRVEDRTKAIGRQTLQLQAATDVSRAISSELNATELMHHAVNLIQERFALYYVGLFLLDDPGQFAVLNAGTGKAGVEMLANHYQLGVNEDSMIGWCIKHTEARIAQGAEKESVRFHYPLLPDTHSEVALPLISLGQVIGAISIQSEQESAFTPEDITIFQTMADQLANGIEKARLYEEIQQRAIELSTAREAADRAKNDAEKARVLAEEANRNLTAQMWQTAGQAQLNEKMRGEQNVSTLSYNVIQHLCKYLKAYSGAIYTLTEKNLNLTGVYAHRRKSFAQQYQIGEDVVGQAALEQGIVIHQMPDEYITLGLQEGRVLPKFRLVAPIISNQHVSGVVALEAMTEFTAIQQRFLKDAIESVAIALTTAQARARVDELFTQTRLQAEELQTQKEELRATNEELESQTKSLRDSETRLKANQAALEQANAELEENTQILQEKQTALDRQNQVLREAQQELERKAEELTITNQYKSEFLANMSHELRTPLNSLLILSGILAKNESGNLTPNQAESAQIIYASGTDLLQLINDILDLSKVEAGHMTFTFAPMLLKNIAQNMQIQFEHVAAQKQLEFNIHVSNELPENITTDQQRVEQVIKNLLSNAFKFTEKGAVELTIEPAEEMIAIRVRDSGIGMTPEQQQRVFEAFQQADGSTSRKYGGTGLGLTISREMSAKLGGRIGLESEPGKGSVFTLYLPSTPPAEIVNAPAADPVSTTVPPEKGRPAPTPAVKAPASSPSKPTSTLKDDRNTINKGDRVLLVIEDDAKFAKILLDYAHKKDFKCVLAGDGESGLKMATIYHPNAILLDLNLPGMSGWEVLDTLKGDASLRHIPVHILSATDQTMDAYNRGALGFLSKPVSKQQLDDVFSTLGEFISRDIKSLLIVEDDNILRHSVGLLLGGSDVKISEAASGQGALDLLQHTRFDCMILDLTLPDMSGFELLSKINNDAEISKCPIIIYTGKALTEQENAELLKYASSVIIKGVKSPERLLDETALFLHRVVADMPAEKQNTIRLLHDRDAVFSGKHILVVDDNMRNAFALASLLNDKNLKVTIARSGMKALEILDAVPDIDLVLMDIMMPEMDGYETMQKIRAQQKFRNLPILALTAKAMKGDMEKGIAAGANDYLSKPIDSDRLFSMLRVWLYR